LTQEGLIDRWPTPFNEALKGYNNKFKYIQAELTTVNKNNSIKIKPIAGGVQTISYDYLVLATGFQYPEPIKHNDVIFLADRKKAISEAAEKIRNASSILVVGAGPVGIELTGELNHTYGGQKKLGIATRGQRLLSHYPAKAGEIAEEFLRQHNVNVHLGVNYVEAFSQDNGYDLTFVCLGQMYSAPFMKDNFLKTIAPNGQIYVNNFMQVIDVDPKTNDNPIPIK
jgi:NADH dehydrogenase FAD-containing subunit